VTPKQKADVIEMIVKDDPSQITLAIGDGANDVNMIKQAHIGVGIFGNEGERAAQSADFAFGEFRFLWRLLFHHGRMAYIRNTEVIIYFFYKNFAVTVPHVLFAYYNGFSAETVYDEFYIQMYNTVLTASALFNKACLEWDVNPDIDGEDLIWTMPKLYYVGQHRTIFNMKNFVFDCGMGIFHAVIVYFVPLYAYGNTSILSEETGSTTEMWTFSVTSFTAMMFVINLKLIVESRYFTYLNAIAIFPAALLLYIAFMWASNYLEFMKTEAAIVELHSSSGFYLTVLVCVVLAFAIDFSIMAYRVLIKQTPADFLR
jgi:magnesium-transporting ATPase (P-type)